MTFVPYEALLRRRLELRVQELEERLRFVQNLNFGPRCHVCGRPVPEMNGYLCGGCLRLPEHCNCKSLLTQPIQWRRIE